MMTRLKCPPDCSSVSVAGRDYEIGEDGFISVAEADVQTLKRMGFKEIADMQVDELRASVPNLDTATVEELTAWLVNQGVEIPPWRDILVANVKRVVALKEAGVATAGPIADAQPEEPAPVDPQADPRDTVDPASLDWDALKALAIDHYGITVTSVTSRAALTEAVLSKRVELLNGA